MEKNFWQIDGIAHLELYIYTYDLAPILKGEKKKSRIEMIRISETIDTCNRAPPAAYSYDGDAVIFIFAEQHHSLAYD